MTEAKDLPSSAASTPTVGIMLPVRIETRFFKDDTLRLLVVPDLPWFARHDSRVSRGEVVAVELYLAAVAAAGSLSTPAQVTAAKEQAWADLVTHVGGARAVFLLRNLVSSDPDGHQIMRPIDPSVIREEPQFPRILGFPEELTVWIAHDGQPAQAVATLHIDRTRLLADFPAVPDEDGSAPGVQDHRWWENWDEAVQVGLGTTITLGVLDPHKIDALYVTGLGDGNPAELFANHRDEGRLGLFAPGTATNTLEGAPAAPLGQDPATWWDVLQTSAGDTDRLVSAALTGDPELLGNLPGPAEPHRSWNAAMVAGLWPALWGFAGQCVWGIPTGTDAAAMWAPGALFPEGPFPTLRIGAQPYGLLPASVLQLWTPASGDPPVEAGLQAALLDLRANYAAAAQARGTVVGASTATLLDLIGQVPTSPSFRYTKAGQSVPWNQVIDLAGYPPEVEEDVENAEATLRKRWEGLGLSPDRRYWPGVSVLLQLPLVVPAGLPAPLVRSALSLLYELAYNQPSVFARTATIDELLVRHLTALLPAGQTAPPPDSLLLRLVIRSLQVAIGDVGRPAGESRPWLEPTMIDDETDPLPMGRLEGWIRKVEAGSLTASTPPVQRFWQTAKALLVIRDVEPARTERLLRATVDSAAFRIDPWLVGPPTRRLQDLVDGGTAKFRLGAYGWVDHPAPGTPGPTQGGLLLAPSPAQALTATVLRDRAVNEPFSGGRWDLDLTSRRVRDADRIAEHVRVGAHLAEAVGREVERAVGELAAVQQLRKKFPLRIEHEGRRTCDGLAILAADPTSLQLSSAQLDNLKPLREALDAYGDLLITEAVYHVTEGRTEVAGPVMDAAAGLSRPPELGVLRTPREGRAVTTSVVLVLADPGQPVLPADPVERAEVSPASLADPAAAAFVQAQLSAATPWTFGVHLGADPGASTVVTLASLGLLPADALALPLTDLERLACEEGAQALGVAPDQVQLDGTGRERYERAVRLVGLIGRRPAGMDAVSEDAEAALAPAPIHATLVQRYTDVHGTATTLREQLTELLAATDQNEGKIGEADPIMLGRLIRAARSWGIAPDPPPSVTAGASDPEDAAGRLLVATARRAVELLSRRLGAAPPAAATAGLSLDDLIAALVTLISPTGQLAVTAPLEGAQFPTLQASPGLDTDWLPMVAAVREPLARLDVHQLSAAPGGTTNAPGPLVAWTNKPGDTWQQDADDSRRMVVVYADPGLNLGNATSGTAPSTVAVAALDRLAEVIPAVEQTIGAAFGFDAPAARAPQAILLAVPPSLDTPIEETLVDILADTRLLLRARMARPNDLPADLQALLPATLLPATGPTAVPLTPA